MEVTAEHFFHSSIVIRMEKQMELHQYDLISRPILNSQN